MTTEQYQITLENILTPSWSEKNKREMSPAEWLIDGIRPNGDCLEWVGRSNECGYGLIAIKGISQMVRAHRIAWVLANGTIPDGMNVLHRCDNPPCCNPDHLFLGTKKENTDDARSKGRLSGGSMPGELNPNAKLTNDIVQDIRRRHANGESIRSIARSMPISRRTISNIVRGLTWRHV